MNRIVKAACVKNVAETTVDEVLTTGRFLFQSNVKQEVQSSANEYDLGIRIASIQIQSLQPPTKVAGAFRDVSSAREDKHKLVREAEREIATARSPKPAPRRTGRYPRRGPMPTKWWRRPKGMLNVLRRTGMNIARPAP